MVMQREINTFILDTFGKYLKPAILDAIRREVDPSFSEARFEELFNASLPAGPAPGGHTPVHGAGFGRSGLAPGGSWGSPGSPADSRRGLRRSE